MTGEKTQVQGLTYNAIDQRFEAIVLFREPGEVIKYSCSLSYPIDAKREDVIRGLIAVAKSRRSSGLLSMSSRRPSKPVSKSSPLAKIATWIAGSFAQVHTQRST